MVSPSSSPTVITSWTLTVHPWLMKKGGGSMGTRRRTDGWQGCMGKKTDRCQEDGRVKKVELRWTWYSCVFWPHNYDSAISIMYSISMIYATFPTINSIQLSFNLNTSVWSLRPGLLLGPTEPTSRERKLSSLVAARRLLTSEPVLVSLVLQSSIFNFNIYYNLQLWLQIR